MHGLLAEQDDRMIMQNVNRYMKFEMDTRSFKLVPYITPISIQALQDQSDRVVITS